MKILLIEDEKTIREALIEQLKSQHFSVDAAINGEKGSAMAQASYYDLIVLDNILPKKNGLEVCREIRSYGKHVPIIILSVETETMKKVDLLNAGADDYLTKPFAFEELLARIYALLRRPLEVLKEDLSIADLRVSISKQTVTRGNEKIYLTRKEFDLLEYLIKNKGAVLSRNMIMEHVWDIDANPFSNTVETHILKLRRKIDSPKRAKLIHTVPARGYKLDIANCGASFGNNQAA